MPFSMRRDAGHHEVHNPALSLPWRPWQESYSSPGDTVGPEPFDGSGRHVREAILVVNRHITLMQEQGKREAAGQLRQYVEFLEYQRAKQPR
jgi:hypothetical protein